LNGHGGIAPHLFAFFKTERRRNEAKQGGLLNKGLNTQLQS